MQLCAGVYLGGDGREILIDPLISGPRRGEGARELPNMWEKERLRAIKPNEKEGEKNR